MGRKAKLKEKRRRERQKAEQEGWPYFTSRRFLGEVQRLIHDSGMDMESSVGAVKVLKQIADDVGLRLYPLSVEVTVYNEVFANEIQENGLDPNPKRVEELGEQGGRFVVYGSRAKVKDDEDNWHGYLVAVLKAANKPPMILDIAIGQATRMEHGILCSQPMVFGVPQGFLKGQSCAVGYQGTPKGKNCYVYRAFPDDTGFEKTLDWQRDYGAKAHDKVDFGDMPEQAPPPPGVPSELILPPEPSGLLGPDGLPLGPAGG